MKYFPFKVYKEMWVVQEFQESYCCVVFRFLFSFIVVCPLTGEKGNSGEKGDRGMPGKFIY